MSGVLIVMEQRGGAWNRMSWETLAAGQQLAAQLGSMASAVVAGQGIDALAGELAKKKLERVYAVEPRFAHIATRPMDIRPRSSN